MLMLIQGITGSLGQLLAQEALRRNHAVRGLGRTPSKLPSDLRDKLEDFVSYNNYWDIPTLEKACNGVDAVLCAGAIDPQLQLEGQLMLLRAAERKGVTRFVAQSWNADYRPLKLGQHECYDPYICFREQLKLAPSKIKPIYIMNGVFAESWFGTFNQDYSSDNMPGLPWQSKRGLVNSWGTGDELISCVTMRDTAEYTIRILERTDAVQGGDWLVTSFAHTVKEMMDIYEKVKGKTLDLKIQGSIEDLAGIEQKKRGEGVKTKYWEYIGLTYCLFHLDGTFETGTDNRNSEFPDEVRTGLEDFFREHPEI